MYRRTIIALSSLVLSACTGGEANATTDVQCLEVSPEKVGGIESGLEVQGGGSLRNVKAVRSGSHAEAYFVSADLQGPGLEGDHEIATWMTTDIEGYGGLVVSVSEHAKGFSVFPDGAQTQARATMSDPGARESVRCSQGR